MVLSRPNWAGGNPCLAVIFKVSIQRVSTRSFASKSEETRLGVIRFRPYLPWLISLAGPVLLLAPMILRGQALFWGTPLLQFVPWREYALQSLREGYLPLWNPNVGMGAPLLANYQSALLYPPNFLLALTRIAWGHGVLVLLHLIWAGSGMVFLTRRLGIGQLGQAIAGLSFSMSGYLIARAGFLSINAASAWLPWLIAATDGLARQTFPRLLDRGRLRAAVYLSLAVSMQLLAGHAQMTWYSLVLAAVWLVWRSGSSRSIARLARAVLSYLVAVLTGALMASAQLLPTLEYLMSSQRASSLTQEFALTYSFWPWRILGLLMPNLFGNPGQGEYWGYGNYWEDAIYIGVLPLILAIGAAWRGLRAEGSFASLARLLLGVSVAALVLALGDNTPVFPFLFEHVATFSAFQAPTRWNLLLVFSLCALAAIGADRWGRLSSRGRYWVRLTTVGAAAIGVAPWLAGQLIPSLKSTFAGSFAAAGLWLVVAGILALKRANSSPQLWIGWVSLAVLVDLLWSGMGLNPSASLDLFYDHSRLINQVDANHRLFMPSETEYEIKFERTFRFDTYMPEEGFWLLRETGLPNAAMLDGLRSANNFDPILPSRYAEWIDFINTLGSSQRSKFLALMDVGWEAAPDPTSETGISYLEVDRPKRLRLVPRAVRSTTSEASMVLITAPGFDPDRMVVLEGGGSAGALHEGGHGRVELRAEEPNRILAQVEAPAGGWLVLSDIWYPGWRARLDQRETPVRIANFLFRAVWVPPGTHEVEFRYQPISFQLGAALSLLGWALAAWTLWRCRSR